MTIYSNITENTDQKNESINLKINISLINVLNKFCIDKNSFKNLSVVNTFTEIVKFNSEKYNVIDIIFKFDQQ